MYDCMDEYKEEMESKQSQETSEKEFDCPGFKCDRMPGNGICPIECKRQIGSDSTIDLFEEA